MADALTDDLEAISHDDVLCRNERAFHVPELVQLIERREQENRPEIQLLDARLDEVKRIGAILQRFGQLNGAKATHFHNRVQALEIERERVVKTGAVRTPAGGGDR